MFMRQEGEVSFWDRRVKLHKALKLSSESCNSRDLWVTSFTPLHGSNKIALALTSKEIGWSFKVLMCLKGVWHFFWMNCQVFLETGKANQFIFFVIYIASIYAWRSGVNKAVEFF
jgi:hypothetical protein